MDQSTFETLYNEAFPFWRELSEGERGLLCRSTALIRYPKGANIHGGQNECTGAILVKSGCVRAYLLSEEGREVTLYRLYPGDICMLSASCVLEAITFDVSVDAEEDSECLVLNGQSFAQVTRQNLHARNYALEIAVERFSDVMWVMQQILFVSFDKRLAIFLWDEMAKTREDTIHLTHEQIAKYMGSAREVVSRALKYLAAEGIVALSRGGVRILNASKLRSLAFQ